MKLSTWTFVLCDYTKNNQLHVCKQRTSLWMKSSTDLHLYWMSGGSFCAACIAGGIVGVRNKVLAAGPLKASSSAARRMENWTWKSHQHENYGFSNSPHASVQEKLISRERYKCQSNVRRSLIIIFPKGHFTLFITKQWQLPLKIVLYSCSHCVRSS